MGNDISMVGGAAATAVTAGANVLTLGQSKTLSEAADGN